MDLAAIVRSIRAVCEQAHLDALAHQAPEETMQFVFSETLQRCGPGRGDSAQGSRRALGQAPRKRKGRGRRRGLPEKIEEERSKKRGSWPMRPKKGSGHYELGQGGPKYGTQKGSGHFLLTIDRLARSCYYLSHKKDYRIQL